MKNFLLLLITVVAFNFSTQAQKNKKSTPKLIVPEMVNTSFTTNYSDTVKKNWEKNHMGNYVAKFSNEKESQMAEFNKDGVLLKSITNYTVDNVPEVVANSINMDYADSKINSAEKIMIEKMMPYFKVTITTATNKNKTLLVSEEGIITE